MELNVPYRFQMETISSTNKCASGLVHSELISIILQLIKLNVYLNKAIM